MSNQEKMSKNDLQPIKNIIDPRYGKVKLAFDRQTGLHFTIKEQFIQTLKQGKFLEKALEKRIQNPNLYYVPIHDYKVETINQFCSKMTKAKIVTAMPDEDLRKEIKKKAETRQSYTNMEMTFLLYDIVFGLAHMEDLGISHGKFGPEWVALTTTGYAIMEDPLYFGMKNNGFVNLKGKKDVYLAPEVFHYAINHQPLPKGHDYLKADVFSAGLVLLEASNLQRMKVIYGAGKRKEILAEVLAKKLSRFRNRYPDNNLLLSTVSRMVEIDPKKRPTFREIREKLPDYQMVKQHFLANEDSAPVEDEYEGYGDDNQFYGEEMSRGMNRTFQSQNNGFMKSNRLGGQRGCSMPRLPSGRPSMTQASQNMDQSRYGGVGQSGMYSRPSRGSVSPLKKQYGNANMNYSNCPPPQLIDNENAGYNEGNFTDRRPTRNNQERYSRHESMSPIGGAGLKRNASWVPKRQDRFSNRPGRPSNRDESEIKAKGDALGPNPQYGSKKPLRKKENNDPDEHPLSDPEDQSPRRISMNRGVSQPVFTQQNKLTPRGDKFVGHTPEKKITTKTSQGWFRESEDIMISPSGVKMKREVTERHLKTPEGNELIKYDVKWKPVASQNGMLMNEKESDVFYPQNNNNHHGQRLSNMGGSSINKVALSRTPSPHRERRQQQQLPEKSPIAHNFTQNNQENYYQQTPQQQNRQPPKGGYPVEDPRNPFHQEYLKLKALYDGKTPEQRSEYKPPREKNITIQPPKPKYQPPKLVVKRISGQSSKQESLKNPSLQQKGSKGVKNEPNRTLKKNYNPPQVPTDPSTSRPATIILETPISNDSTPLKIQQQFMGNPQAYHPVRTNLMNEYHYCDDCDVAFQPYNNHKPEDDLSYYDDHSGHSARRIKGIPYNLPSNTTKTSFIQKSLKDADGYSRGVQSQISGKDVSPYTPPAYSPDKDHFQAGGNMPPVYHNRHQDENFNDNNVIGANPYQNLKGYGDLDLNHKRPQLVRSTKRPQFIGNQLNYQPLREIPCNPHHQQHHHHHHQLGRSGLKVSKISYGNWINCSDAEEGQKLANELVKVSFSKGINFFDTAENYGKGEGERQLGVALKNLEVPRSDYAVSTKIFNGDFAENSNKVNNKGTSRKRIMEGMNRSLKNLQLDYVDIVFCHKWDAWTPIDELVLAMKQIIKEGKAMYWGTSNFPPVKVMEALLLSDKHGCPRPVAQQTQYNMLYREKLEKDFVFHIKDYGYGTTVWSPLAAGVLTGKYNEGIPEGSRFSKPENQRFMRIFNIYMGEGKKEKTIESLNKLEQVAKRLGGTLPQLALAWNTVFNDVSTSIIGASRVEQLEENLGCLDLIGKLTEDVLEEIEGILGNRPSWGCDYRNGRSDLPYRR